MELQLPRDRGHLALEALVVRHPEHQAPGGRILSLPRVNRGLAAHKARRSEHHPQGDFR
jgi:hypothetical protein